MGYDQIFQPFFLIYSLLHKHLLSTAQALHFNHSDWKLGTKLQLVIRKMSPLLIVEVIMNDTTSPWTQNSGQQKNVNTRIISTDKTSKTQEGFLSGNNSASSPLCNAVGAKPKNKSFPWEMGGWVIARAKHPEICNTTGWPTPPSRQSAWSTPVLSRTQPWIAAKGRTSNKPPNNKVYNSKTDSHCCYGTLNSVILICKRYEHKNKKIYSLKEDATKFSLHNKM